MHANEKAALLIVIGWDFGSVKKDLVGPGVLSTFPAHRVCRKVRREDDQVYP